MGDSLREPLGRLYTTQSVVPRGPPLTLRSNALCVCNLPLICSLKTWFGVTGATLTVTVTAVTWEELRSVCLRRSSLTCTRNNLSHRRKRSFRARSVCGPDSKYAAWLHHHGRRNQAYQGPGEAGSLFKGFTLAALPGLVHAARRSSERSIERSCKRSIAGKCSSERVKRGQVGAVSE